MFCKSVILDYIWGYIFLSSYLLFLDAIFFHSSSSQFICETLFRAKYIIGTVKALQSKPCGGLQWLAALRKLDLVEAVDALATLPGVGPKVAACIALFSLEQHHAIPVDTHVWKVTSNLIISKFMNSHVFAHTLFSNTWCLKRTVTNVFSSFLVTVMCFLLKNRIVLFSFFLGCGRRLKSSCLIKLSLSNNKMDASTSSSISGEQKEGGVERKRNCIILFAPKTLDCSQLS